VYSPGSKSRFPSTPDEGDEGYLGSKSPSEKVAVEFVGRFEDDGFGGHVDAHRKRLRSEQHLDEPARKHHLHDLHTTTSSFTAARALFFLDARRGAEGGWIIKEKEAGNPNICF
jgi:hypothetical protein